jgi:hypothetical protein
MGILQSVTEKINQLSEADFEYASSSDFSKLESLNNDCTGIVMEANVIYFEINNIDFMLKTGKRLAARVYKMYYHILHEICETTGGHFNCYSPKSFLLIYPKEKFDETYVANIAVKTANLFNVSLRETFEKHTHLNFGIGMDHGNILGTKAIDENGSPHIAWFGNAIEKAIALCHLSQRPFLVSVSRSVYHHLDDSLKVTTKHILGIKKEVSLWTRMSYQFDNVKKHMYQTNAQISFNDE